MSNGFTNPYQPSALQSPMMQPLGLTDGAQQQLSPQFLNLLLPALPGLIGGIIGAIRQAEAQPQLGQASALSPASIVGGLPWNLPWMQRPAQPQPAQPQLAQASALQPLGVGAGLEQQLSPQGIFNSVVSAISSTLPVIIDTIRRMEAQPQLAQASVLQPMGLAGGAQQQLSPQGIFDAVLRNVIPIAINMIRQLEAQPQLAQASALQPMGLAGGAQQQLSPQGIFDVVLRNVIPIAIETIRRLEAQPQLAQASALQPMGVGAGVEQQLSPQFLNVLLPIVTSLIPPLVNMIRR